MLGSLPYSSVKFRACSFTLVVALSSGALHGCSRSQVSPRPPLVLAAVDGLEWDVLLPLLSRGELPVMERLIDAGTAGYLKSMYPTFSPVIWTSMATAKTPAKHGITGFVYRPHADRAEERVFTSGDRRTKAFWDILGDQGLVVYCIGWWITYPAEAINGVMVSQTNTGTLVDAGRGHGMWKGNLVKGLEGQVYPPARQDAVMARLAEVDSSLPETTRRIFGTFPHPPDAFSGMMWDETQWAIRADETYLRAAQGLLADGERFDVLAIYIGGTDVVGHRFWRYAYPESFQHPPSSEQIENYRHVIDDYYRYADQAIGSLLAALPRETTVLVVSDHGMHAANRERDFRPEDPARFTYSGHHLDAPPGVFIAAGRGIRGPGPDMRARSLVRDRLPTVGSVFDVTPTVLALEGVAIGKDMDGAPLRDVITPDALAEHPIRFVGTHDTDRWLAGREAYKRVPLDQTERVDQLKALGYVQ